MVISRFFTGRSITTRVAYIVILEALASSILAGSCFTVTITLMKDQLKLEGPSRL
jgi:hypothetical protein